MKTIKVCGRHVGLLSIAGPRHRSSGRAISRAVVCFAGLNIAGLCLSGCTVADNIPYRQVIYKATYNYLRAAECQNSVNQQLAYEPCLKSYAEDYESYRQLREQYVRNSTTNGSS